MFYSMFYFTCDRSFNYRIERVVGQYGTDRLKRVDVRYDVSVAFKPRVQQR